MKLENVIATRSNKTIYRDGNTCIKVFNEDFSKIDVLNEALNQARIEETGLNIPHIQGVTMIDGKWAIMYDYIKGKTLEELIKENPEKKEEYMNLFVDIQTLIHTKRCPMLNKIKEKMIRKITMTNLSYTVKYDLQTQIDGMKNHVKVCHGDFNPSNIIITEDNVPYIIDWAHVTQGNASADAARTYLLYCLHGDKETAEQYLDLFCKKSGIDKRNIQKWMPIVAASQTVKGNKEEIEFLLSWVDVVDYQ